jgi:hypothetical protein
MLLAREGERTARKAPRRGALVTPRREVRFPLPELTGRDGGVVGGGRRTGSEGPRAERTPSLTLSCPDTEIPEEIPGPDVSKQVSGGRGAVRQVPRT